MAKHEVVEPVYLEMTQPHGDARYGKMAKGKVVAVDPDRAGRWVGAGIAKEVSKSAYDKSREERIETGDARARAFGSQEMSDAHLWDIGYRDAARANPEKLQEVMDSGITVLNTGALVDKDGIPLQSDATFEEIMEARDRVPHPDADLSYGHTQSSVSGSSSHYQEAIPDSQKPDADTLDTARPARRVGRMQRSQIGNTAEDSEKPKRTGHTTTVGDSLGNVSEKQD